MAISAKAQWVAASALPGNQYAAKTDFWLFAVVKVLLLIYKGAKIRKKTVFSAFLAFSGLKIE
jgi:hypothetical protein